MPTKTPPQDPLLQLAIRHQFVPSGPKAAATAKPETGLARAIEALMVKYRDGTALRDAILAFFSEREPGLTRTELEAFFSQLILVLPRRGPAADLLQWAYESRIRIALKDNRQKRAMEIYKQYLGDCAPRCDERFDQTYVAALICTGSVLLPLARRLRLYVLMQLLQKTLPLSGLVAECGSFRGLSSYMLCSYMKEADPGFKGRGYRIFDSFAGLSDPGPEDAIARGNPDTRRLEVMSRRGGFAIDLGKVKNNLLEHPEIEYYPGWIPDAFPDEPKACYRFVHVDVDLYQPTLDSFEYFYPKLVPGGYIVSDDYNWPGARKAIETFVLRHRLKLRTTPTGQAYIKRGR